MQKVMPLHEAGPNHHRVTASESHVLAGIGPENTPIGSGTGHVGRVEKLCNDTASRKQRARGFAV